ncbi:murein transglycosylase A [Methylobrevis albus]|uniref:peptidoglycan lytic exotransglycosylase n=1 Tax=Methylobrevis albus TaxID=2793297 RepID=A0A931I1U1_9HYPH|nr:MltA domain-containing protein [Methylobrevis albus]MBH0237723.1 MltA domain-containing protein [Methylobrevis albus]
MAPDPAVARLTPTRFAALGGWDADDHAAAFAAFRLSAARILEHPPSTKGFGIDGAALLAPARAALALPADPGPAAARRFFEDRFTPQRVRPATGSGFVTGYFEPEVGGSRTRSDRFPVPLYRRPDDLVALGDDPGAARAAGLPDGLSWARRRPDGRLEEHPDRGAIQQGALEGRGLELVFVKSLVEAFFIHVQGSARIRLAEGGSMRVGFAAKTGHAYTAIGRVLVERGLFEAKDLTADVLRAWLEANPAEVPALLARNRSFIFFAEAAATDPALGPVAAAGVPLTPGRSLAVDRALVTFHLPVWLSLDVGLDGVAADGGRRVRRLMVAQDTGSAIVGPARGDIFFGSGEAAWRQAAPVRHPARFTLLVPRRRGPARRGD